MRDKIKELGSVDVIVEAFVVAVVVVFLIVVVVVADFGAIEDFVVVEVC